MHTSVRIFVHGCTTLYHVLICAPFAIFTNPFFRFAIFTSYSRLILCSKKSILRNASLQNITTLMILYNQIHHNKLKYQSFILGYGKNIKQPSFQLSFLFNTYGNLDTSYPRSC